MPQSEIIPQSIVDLKIIVLKPRLDHKDIHLIGEEIGPRLFSKFGFKPRSEVIRLLCIESYFEPFLIIGGKYSLDYCKKHVFKVEVDKRTRKLFVAGQEFKSEKSNPMESKRKIKLTGEEHAHHERQGYFILDRMKREIPPEKMPIAPFNVCKKNPECKSHFKRMNISEHKQIHFLKTKIAERPDDVAEIIKENFDITNRTLAYYPMYELTFENSKNKKEASVTVNGITGEIKQNGNKKFSLKTILVFPESVDPQSEFATACLETEMEPILGLASPDLKDNEKGVQKDEKRVQSIKVEGEETVYGDLEIPSGTPLNKILVVEAKDNEKGVQKDEKRVRSVKVEDEETVYGDLEIPSGTTINKTLIVKGSLKIGNNCRARGRLKALKDITIGADTIIDGDLISGGNIFVGARSLISGSVKAKGIFEIEQNAIVEGASISTSAIH